MALACRHNECCVAIVLLCVDLNPSRCNECIDNFDVAVARSCHERSIVSLDPIDLNARYSKQRLDSLDMAAANCRI